MSDEHIPAPGEPVNAESFGRLAAIAAREASSSTLLVTVLDENKVPVGELIQITNIPPDPEERPMLLKVALSLIPDELCVGLVRIAFAFVDLDAAGGENVDSYLGRSYCFRTSELN